MTNANVTPGRHYTSEEMHLNYDSGNPEYQLMSVWIAILTPDTQKPLKFRSKLDDETRR